MKDLPSQIEAFDSWLTEIEKSFLIESKSLKPLNSQEAESEYPKISVPSGAVSVSVKQVREHLEADKGLFEVFSTRRSTRKFSSININEVCSLLFNGCRVRETWTSPNGKLLSSRPTPSAGASHPIEIICIASDVQGMQRGCWYFDPYGLTLHLIPVSHNFCTVYENLASSVLESEIKPPLLILFPTILRKTLSRYKNGLSLVWRDVGALTATLCFAAQGLKLNSCPLGFSHPLISANYFGLNEGESWVMGGVAIGGNGKVQ